MCPSPTFRRVLSTLAVLASLAWPWPASTTVVLRADLPMLARLADCIIEGRVFQVSSAWNERHSQILTHVVLDVSQVHGGDCRLGRTEILMLGGAVNDTILLIPGAPSFTVGEDVVLFMSTRAGIPIPILGLSQGKMLASKDAGTSIERVGNDTVGYFTRAQFNTTVARERARGVGR